MKLVTDLYTCMTLFIDSYDTDASINHMFVDKCECKESKVNRNSLQVLINQDEHPGVYDKNPLTDTALNLK